MKKCTQLLFIELKANYRSGGELLWAVMFFLLLASMFPFLYVKHTQSLQDIVLPILLYGAILSQLLLTTSLAHRINEEGVHELIHLSGRSPTSYFLITLIAVWLLLAFPLICVMPIISLMYGISFQLFAILLVAILISLFVVAGYTLLASSMLTISNSGLLAIIFVFPFLVPIFIACGIAFQGNGSGLLLLIGYFFTSLPIILTAHKYIVKII